jgi:hypothetical protein
MVKKCVYFSLDNQTQNKDKNKNKKIHKLVPLDFYIINEITNISNIKKYKTHFYTCKNTSSLKITDKEIKEIKEIKETKEKETIILEFKDIILYNFNDYLQSLNSFKIYILTIINSYNHLLDSISLLLEHNLIHNHITLDNILVDKHENILLSNFSLSISIPLFLSMPFSTQNNIKQFFLTYDPEYILFPLELHIFSYMLNKNIESLSLYNIESIINDVIIHNKILNIFGNKIVTLYTQEGLSYFKKYINVKIHDVYKDIFTYSHTWDNFSLSIQYLKILIKIHQKINKKKFIVLFMNLLVTNIHSVPSKRLTISQTKEKFNNILEQLSSNDYKDIINS